VPPGIHREVLLVLLTLLGGTVSWHLRPHSRIAAVAFFTATIALVLVLGWHWHIDLAGGL
jgi:hypothetical protein